jgi:transposase
MRQANKRIPESAEKTVRDIRRATRRHHSAEEKIRIVLEGLLGRQLAASVFDNESSLLDRRCCKKTQARAGTADTESSLAGHIRHVRRFAPVQPHRDGSALVAVDSGVVSDGIERGHAVVIASNSFRHR